MTDVSERERIALHEAAHHVVAAIYGWKLGAVTIEAGTVLDGCSLAAPPLVAVPVGVDYAAPYVRWPASVRERIEGEALMFIAGDVAELLFAPRVGRVPEPAAVKATEMVTVAAEEPEQQPELPAATAQEQARVVAVCNDPAAVSDAENVARLARYAHEHDPAAAAAWIGYLETQARALLLAQERRVRRLSDVLVVAGTVGSEAAARLLA